MVDVGKLMSQLERSKQEKFDSEARLETTHQIVTNLKEAAEKHVSIKEKLQVSLAMQIILKVYLDIN